MQNSASNKSYRTILGAGLTLVLAVILNVSPDYAQAGYGVAPTF